MGNGDAHDVLIHSPDRTVTASNRSAAASGGGQGGQGIAIGSSSPSAVEWDTRSGKAVLTKIGDGPRVPVKVIIRWRQAPIHRWKRKKKWVFEDPKNILRADIKKQKLQVKQLAAPLKPNF